MALQLKLNTTTTINAEGTRVTLTDGTGNYNVSTNPGGYGSPNTSRNQVAVFVLGLNKSNKGDKQLTLATYNPTTVISFNAIIPLDGWLQFNIIGLAFYNSTNLQDYIGGQVYYNTATNQILKIVETYNYSVTPPETGNTAVPIDLFELKDSDYIQSHIDVFFVANSSKIKLKINAKISDILIENTLFTDKQLIRHKDNYNAVRAILQGAIYEYARGNKYVAQNNIEFLNSNNYLQD